MKPVRVLWWLPMALMLTGPVQADCNDSILPTRPDSRYTPHGDGTVTDPVTGLTWARCPLGLSGSSCDIGTAERYNWQQALEAVQDANAGDYLGHDDWRLPNAKELHSLIETACREPAINSILFPATTGAIYSNYWSASPSAAHDNSAWYADFANGGINDNLKIFGYAVRLVRDGE